MEIGSENAPSWDIRVLKGELSGAINYLTSSADNGENSKVQRIPQLDFDVSYKVAIGWGPAPGDRNIIGGPYNDGTYLYLPEGIPELIFSVDEKNASNETEYDIEVYEVNTVGKQRILTPKLFREKIPIVVDGLLLDNEERAAILRDERPPTEDMVRYYFNIDTDLDIPEEQICELIQHLKTRGGSG